MDSQRLFKRMRHLDAPAHLEAAVLGRIRAEAKRRARWTVWGYAAGSMVSLGAGALGGRWVMAVGAQTGFFDYLSLVFSGDSSVFAYWRELSLSLVESLPVLGIVVILAGAAGLVWSSINTIAASRRIYARGRPFTQ